MKLHDLEKAHDFDVKEWLYSSIPNLTNEQKWKIINDEVIRFAPFYFMKKRKKTKNVWLRFSIIFIIPVLIIFFIGLPFNYFICGRWGYDEKIGRWFRKWISDCGF